MNIEGKLHVKMDAQQVSATFRKREFVVEFVENPLYPQYVKFEMIQDRCDLLDPFNVGDKIDVSFNLKGREWTDPQGVKKYFTSLEAWRIQKVQVPVGVGLNEAPAYDMSSVPADLSDDLPF